MAEITVETLFQQITQLPPPEQSRLWRMLESLRKPAAAENGSPLNHAETTAPARGGNGAPDPQTGARSPKRVPKPNKDRELQWLQDHSREYIGQWVALDGDRLIAHGSDAKAIYAAARADGAYLPMVTQVEDPDRIFLF